jgi:hypothetical protein
MADLAEGKIGTSFDDRCRDLWIGTEIRVQLVRCKLIDVELRNIEGMDIERNSYGKSPTESEKAGERTGGGNVAHFIRPQPQKNSQLVGGR